ncbi:hypothetical protein PR048_030599 [Dryococelus australis]|uniref:Uncharacterized protein n=1 Tax=Dryococelus australis TaxID=614101 RepID=A0ABQ9G9E3_9NEOP|nr:hypothetical protein PR048_030599 [Dryococelus australis]
MEGVPALGPLNLLNILLQKNLMDYQKSFSARPNGATEGVVVRLLASHQGKPRVQFPVGSLPDFRTMMPLVGGFSRGSPVPPFRFILALLHTHLTSFSVSQDPDVKSRSNLPALLFYRWLSRSNGRFIIATMHFLSAPVLVTSSCCVRRVRTALIKRQLTLQHFTTVVEVRREAFNVVETSPSLRFPRGRSMSEKVSELSSDSTYDVTSVDRHAQEHSAGASCAVLPENHLGSLLTQPGRCFLFFIILFLARRSFSDSLSYWSCQGHGASPPAPFLHCRPIPPGLDGAGSRSAADKKPLPRPLRKTTNSPFGPPSHPPSSRPSSGQEKRLSKAKSMEIAARPGRPRTSLLWFTVAFHSVEDYALCLTPHCLTRYDLGSSFEPRWCNRPLVSEFVVRAHVHIRMSLLATGLSDVLFGFSIVENNFAASPCPLLDTCSYTNRGTRVCCSELDHIMEIPVRKPSTFQEDGIGFSQAISGEKFPSAAVAAQRTPPRADQDIVRDQDLSTSPREIPPTPSSRLEPGKTTTQIKSRGSFGSCFSEGGSSIRGPRRRSREERRREIFFFRPVVESRNENQREARRKTKKEEVRNNPHGGVNPIWQVIKVSDEERYPQEPVFPSERSLGLPGPASRLSTISARP